MSKRTEVAVAVAAPVDRHLFLFPPTNVIFAMVPPVPAVAVAVAIAAAAAVARAEVGDVAPTHQHLP